MSATKQQVDVHVPASGASDVARLRDGTMGLFSATNDADCSPRYLPVVNGLIIVSAEHWLCAWR